MLAARNDGSHLKEFAVEPQTAGNGSVWDLLLSRDPEQRWLFLADGRNNQIVTLRRETGEPVGTLGRPGRYAGEFHWVHDLAIDSQGDLYAGEVDNGKRVQRLTIVIPARNEELNLPALLAQGAIPSGMPPAEFAAFIAAEQKRWKPVIARAKIKPD